MVRAHRRGVGVGGEGGSGEGRGQVLTQVWGTSKTREEKANRRTVLASGDPAREGRFRVRGRDERVIRKAQGMADEGWSR